MGVPPLEHDWLDVEWASRGTSWMDGLADSPLNITGLHSAFIFYFFILIWWCSILNLAKNKIYGLSGKAPTWLMVCVTSSYHSCSPWITRSDGSYCDNSHTHSQPAVSCLVSPHHRHIVASTTGVLPPLHPTTRLALLKRQLYLPRPNPSLLKARWGEGVKWRSWCSYRWRPWPQRLPSQRRKASTRGSPQKTFSRFSRGDNATGADYLLLARGGPLSHRLLSAGY